MMSKLSIILVATLMLAGCKNAPESKEESSAMVSEEGATNFKPFVIYQDRGASVNHFVPSGFMPNGKCLKMDDGWTGNCYEGSTCIKSDYDVACSRGDQKWSGVYWLSPANNWARQKGGFNLSGARKLTFWARGEKGGERVEEFKVGGLIGDYPDTDTAVIGPVILSKEWHQYTIDLRGKDLSHIGGGFSWSTSADVNANECIFYMDQIQYE